MAERQALNLCRSGFKSLVAHHAGVKGTGIPRELRPRGLRVRLAPSAPDGHWGNMADPPGPGPGVSWFEARMASFAAAHGCGPAFVRRATRGRHRVAAPSPRRPTVGGTTLRRWAVHVRIAPRTHFAPVAQQAKRTPCKRQTSVRNRSGASVAGCSVGRGAAALNRETTLFESSPASSRLRSSSGQSVSSVRRRSSVRIGPEAPCDRSVSG